MNKDFEDIFKIVSLFESTLISKNECERILSLISFETDDPYRKDKHNQFVERKDELIEKFKTKLGAIQPFCETGDCNKCYISKWCNYYRIKSQAQESEQHLPTYADFFCGSGGLSLGFHNAGFRMSLANDIEKCCIDTIALNHPEISGKHIICGDINNVLDNIKKYSRYKCTDVVIGGPPCQGFSMANRQRIIDDPRNHLYKSFISAIKILHPKFFVMENVRGMLKVQNQIIEDFRNIGYDTTVQLINAADFGIPQNRNRVIFIGNRLGIDNNKIFESINNVSMDKPKRNLIDAISYLPVLKAKTMPNATEVEDVSSGYNVSINRINETNGYIREINRDKSSPLLFNHKARYNNSRDIEIYRRLEQGDNSGDPKIQDIMPYKRREKIFKDKYFKLEENKPCKTITAHMKYDCNMYIHPTQNRGLTPREAARIQSYPDDYFFRGSYTKTYMQVGNSVPPLLGGVIAKVLFEILQED